MQCSYCSEEKDFPFKCKFCQQYFCGEHRLPENHHCEGLAAYKQHKQTEREEGTDEEEALVYDPFKKGSSPEPSTEQLQKLSGFFDRFLFQSATKAVLTIMIIVFILQLFVPGFTQAFSLVPQLAVQEPWRLLTSIFLHGGLFHLFVNGIVLFSFGHVLERLLGSSKFLEILLVGALASSVGYTVSGLAFGLNPAVGISGGLFAIIATFSMLQPRAPVLLFFVLPISIQTALKFVVAIDVINLVSHIFGASLLPIASAGHLSGFLIGLLYGRYLQLRMRPSDVASLLDI